MEFPPARCNLRYRTICVTLFTRVGIVKIGHLEASALNEEAHGYCYRLFGEGKDCF